MNDDERTVWERLQETLPEDAVKWRVQQGGTNDNGDPYAMVVPYPDARWLMDRLDAVAGPENWTTSYRSGPNGGVVCSLAVRTDGEWVAKEDGAENTNIEGVKGGLTDAFKRACVQWNVGGIRALYRTDTCWANIHSGGSHRSKIAGKYRSWDPPEIKLSEAGATVSHKRNGDRRTEVEKQIEDRLGTLKQWSRERAKKARGQYQALDTSVDAKAREFLETVEKAIAQEERKAEQAEREAQEA